MFEKQANALTDKEQNQPPAESSSIVIANMDETDWLTMLMEMRIVNA